ncbi:MAG TPA: hypothetical protein VFF11_11145, partial [Candidatus Binatia bacterium]|nr:hypothetical protein [Candidatus Binatia bacterium]
TNSIDASLSLFAPANLKWSNNGNSGVWDTSSSANWVDLSSSSQTVFNPGDQVLFDDAINVPTNVTVNGSVAPSLITVDSSTNNFNLSSGAITGTGAFIKKGSSPLTITSAGNFTGPVTLSGGSVYAGNNCFASVSSIRITNNATLDMGGGTFNNNKPVTVSGAGVNGQGAIFNSYADYPQESLNVTLAGDAVFGASARWDLASGSHISGPHKLTIDWSAGSGYGEWNSPVIGADVAGITLTNGNLGAKGMDNSFQNPATILTVSTNCQLVFYSGGWNGSLHILGGGQAALLTAPSAFNGSSIVLETGAQWQSYYNTNDEPINSAITLNGIAHFVLGDHNMIYTNVISGPGGFVLDYWNHAVVFSSANTYGGPTIIGSSGNSPAVVLTGNGSISQSSLIFFGGNDPAVERLDASGRSDQTLTLAAGQTLAGIGALNGSLVVSPGATLSPSGTNVTLGITAGANATGTIIVSNSVSLNGTTMIKLNGSGVNDAVQAGGDINYGGTFSLV